MSNKQLSSEQEEGLNKIFSLLQDNKFELSLCGSAGTGKSFVATEIAKRFKGKVRLSATTHKAANVLASFCEKESSKVGTVHSFLGLKLEWRQGRRYLIADKNRQNETELLIIDESSMLNREVYYHLRSALVSERIKYALFVGDPYQLPPINEEFLPFLESSDVILEKIVRQESDNPIIQQALFIRDMIKNRQNEIYRIKSATPRITICRNIYELYESYFANRDDDKIIISYTNKSVDNHNMYIRNRKKPNCPEYEEGDIVISQDVYEVDGNILITNGEEIKIVESEPQDDFWLLTDNYNRSFYVPTMRYKSILKNELESLYQKKSWDEYTRLKRSYIELKYSDACTIHKSQGSTWDSVYLDFRWFPSDMSAEMRNRLTYVALTRAKNSVYVVY